jgi:hypothetical protein
MTTPNPLSNAQRSSDITTTNSNYGASLEAQLNLHHLMLQYQQQFSLQPHSMQPNYVPPIPHFFSTHAPPGLTPINQHFGQNNIF